MSVATEIRERLRALLFWRREEQAMDDEFEFHLEMETQKHLKAGIPPDEARRRARLCFGGVQQQRESVREERGIGTLERVAGDVRYALRRLRKRPGVAGAVVLTLSVGIGATSAVFSLIQGVLLTPPPYDQPDRLALVSPARSDGDRLAAPEGWAAAEWLGWRSEARSFDALAAHRWAFAFLVSEEGSEALEGMWVTRDYFRVTGLEPVIGRTFQESDVQPDAAPVVILGYELWQRRFGGDSSILGTTMRLSGEPPSTIIGVMPPDVRFMPSPVTAQEPNYDEHAKVEYWVPVSPQLVGELIGLNRRIWNVVGRMRDGVTIAQAQTELETISTRQARVITEFAGVAPRLQSLTAVMNREGRRILLPLLGAAALLLLIGCSNAAALLLIRGLQRQQEYGMCSALGAGRIALFRQVTIESLLLALAGGAVGMALAAAIVTVVKVAAVDAVPRLDAVMIGWPVVACALGSSVLAAWLAGLVPALRASRLDPVRALTNAGVRSSVGPAERRLLNGIVLVQTALTLLLLVAAGLLIRTMYNVSHVRSGYDTNGILTMSVTAVEGDWADFHARALERVSALPGVRAAAFAWGVPLTGNSWRREVEVEGQSATRAADDRLILPLRAVTPEYFRILGVEMVDGRDFRATDARGAPSVAVINQAFVERYFPDTKPLGKRLRLVPDPEVQAARIVGVVANARTDDLSSTAEPEIYLSLWQRPADSKHLVVRAESEPLAIAGAVQRALRDLHPTVAIEHVKTLGQVRSDSLATRRLVMQLLVGFALVASVLTIGGIHGVLSLSVASRWREIAIRSALGAERRTLVWLVLGQGARLIVLGLAAGLAAAVALSRVLQSFLFEVEPTDPVTIAAAGLTFAVVALLSCCAPARRAAQANPLEALKGAS